MTKYYAKKPYEKQLTRQQTKKTQYFILLYITLYIYLQDFVTANTQWTKDLCQKDSDMDGKTNGEELGDPNCVWKQGDTPAGDATGHPGKTGQ